MDPDTGRNSHVILLLSFFLFSSSSNACVSSPVSPTFSSQQKILSEFFSCLLLSSSYLMGHKTTKYLAKCWCCIVPHTLPFSYSRSIQSSSKWSTLHKTEEVKSLDFKWCFWIKSHVFTCTGVIAYSCSKVFCMIRAPFLSNFILADGSHRSLLMLLPAFLFCLAGACRVRGRW